MRYLLTTAFLIVILQHSIAQQTISLNDVSTHIGDTVKVCGKVYGVKYLQQAKNSPTFINMGAPYPNQLLTVVIWNDVRKQFEKTPEELFSNKEICVTGKIEMFKGKPQIVVRKKEDVE